jgi:DNA-binding protein HU-beta
MKESSTSYSEFEIAVMAARTPDEYVDESVRSRLPPRAKARLAKVWMRKTGYSVDDIVHARNRHPYWKQKKQENAADRARSRLARHSYSGGGEVEWTAESIGEFLDMNRKDKDGNYAYRDWQIAERFNSTIPSIQYMRRKLIRLQTAARGEPLSKNRLVDSMKRSEVVLKRLEKGELKLKDLATKKAPAAKKSTAAKKPAAKKAAKKPAKKVAKKPAAKKAVKKPAKKVAKKAVKKVAKKVAKKPAAKKAVKKVAKKPAAKKAAKKPAAKKAVKKVAKSPVAPVVAPVPLL